ncbi:MAG: mycothiol system anti-sigma-R factor [Acidimicrobiia bacterium]
MTHDHAEHLHPDHPMTDDHAPDRVLSGGPDCEAALAEVYTYLDHELTDVEHERVLAHLETCSPCFEAFDFEAEFRMVVASKALSDEFPDGLRMRIMERIVQIRIETSADDGDGSTPAGA